MGLSIFLFLRHLPICTQRAHQLKKTGKLLLAPVSGPCEPGTTPPNLEGNINLSNAFPGSLRHPGRQLPQLQARLGATLGKSGRRSRVEMSNLPICPAFPCSWHNCNATHRSRGLHQSAVRFRGYMHGRCHIAMNRSPYGRPVGEHSRCGDDGTGPVKAEALGALDNPTAATYGLRLPSPQYMEGSDPAGRWTTP
jgi:hypothetical protein